MQTDIRPSVHLSDLTDEQIATIRNEYEGVARKLLDAARGDRPLVDDHEAVQAWLDATVGITFPAVENIIRHGLFPALPVEARERITMDELFGDHAPTRIDPSDAEQAVETLDEAARISPLDEDEAHLRQQLQSLIDKSDGYNVWVADGYTDDHLNEQLPFDFPEWLQDHIDWESVYEKVVSYADTAMLEGHTYYFLPNK